MFTSSEFFEDPYPTYALLRRDAPLYFHEAWKMPFFSRHADVEQILRDRRFGRDPRGAVPQQLIDAEAYERIYPSRYPTWNRYIRESFIDFEPPQHTRIRRLVQPAFTQKAVEPYRATLTEVADLQIDRALDEGGLEAIGGYAVPVALNMIATMMGVPVSDGPRLVEWSHAIVKLYDPGCTDQLGALAEEAAVGFVDYMAELVAQRRRQPGTDLLSRLIGEEVEGQRLTDDEIVATSILILNAGHEATVHSIGNGLLALARHPAEYRRLRTNPMLIGTAVAELLRYDAPLHMFERWVLQDLEWDGVALSRGSKVGLLLGSANRDETAFDDPGNLNVGRTSNPHVSFGGGIHRCVGSALALMELEVAFSRFAERISEFSVCAVSLPRTRSLIFRGVDELPLEVAA